jgi:hypothetical protein
VIPRRCPGTSWTVFVNSLEAVLPFYNLRDQLMPSKYPWLRNRCLAINNFSLLLSADMSHVSVAWQRPGWNIHISSDISGLWAECHICRRCPRIHNLYFYNIRDKLLPLIYPWLRNRCLGISNSSLLVSTGMSHVPVA